MKSKLSLSDVLFDKSAVREIPFNCLWSRPCYEAFWLPKQIPRKISLCVFSQYLSWVVLLWGFWFALVKR